MSEPVIIAIVAGLPGLFTSYFVYRSSTKAAEKAARSEMVKVEAGAYERAKKLYEDGIRQLEEQLDRMRRQMAEEQEVSAKLRNQVYELEVTVSMLRRQLVNAGMELAPARLFPDPPASPA